MSRTSVSTFWHGGLPSNYELACLLSFANAGFETVIYSFEPMRGLPSAIENRRAELIDDGSTIDRFIYDGKPNLQHYSDLFRLKLLRAQDTTWIDSDVVLLDAENFASSPTIIGREDDEIVCNAVLRISSDDPLLGTTIDAVAGMTGRTLSWGETGHVVLMSFLEQSGGVREATPAAEIFPIHWHDFWKPFLPQFRAECEHLCSRASCLHLWNNLVVQMGLYKRIGPPRDSFLHAALAKSGAIEVFDDFYPGDVMYRIVENWVARDGEDLGVKRVARLLKSSLLNTYRRRLRSDDRPFLDKRASRSPLARQQG